MKTALTTLLALLFTFACGLTFAQSVQQPKNRIDPYIGVFVPMGGIDDPNMDFTAGLNLGVGYTRFLTENFGIGGFLDINYFYSDDFTYRSYYSSSGYWVVTDHFNLMSMLGGAQITAQLPLNPKNFFYASVKLGLGLASASSTDFDYSGTDVGFILEGGYRHKLGNHFDLGATVKYTAFKPTLDADQSDITPRSMEADFSGVAIAFDAGILF